MGDCALEEAEAVRLGFEGRLVLRQYIEIVCRTASYSGNGRAESGVSLFAVEYPLMPWGEFERALGYGGQRSI